MNRSIFGELYYNVFQSGNRLNLFIGINVLVFLLINLLSFFESLFTNATPITHWVVSQLTLPAPVDLFVRKFWTALTYMFSHRALFHLLFNMLWLYWIGRVFLDFLSKRQFTFIYITGGIVGAALFIIACNTFPGLTNNTTMIGSSVSVMAIVAATATLVPSYGFNLLFFGEVKLQYIAWAYLLIAIIVGADAGAGGSIAQIGSAIFGCLSIRQLQQGHDWSAIFEKGPTLKVIQKKEDQKNAKNHIPDQIVIDAILDKISKSGYNSLTTLEKKQLFQASNKE